MATTGKPSRRRPTIADVAREAGVSVASTGRALGKYGNVSEDLRAQVQAAAERLGYSANSVARSMRSGGTRTIGFVGVDISNAFFAAAMRGVADIAREAGYEPILANTDDRIDLERAAVQVLVEKQVEGIVISPTSVLDIEHLKRAQDRGVALVLLDRSVEVLHADAVVIDNHAAAYEATTHLIELGHRDIGLLAAFYEHEGPQVMLDRSSGLLVVEGASRPSVDRIRGFVAALQDRGIVPNQRHMRYSPIGSTEAAEAAADDLLTSDERPSAVLATDNVATLGAFRASRRAGLHMPNDLSLVGFDDLEWTTLVDPPLTVVAQSPLAMGRLAAERLFARIEGNDEPVETQMVPTTLLVRGSTRAVG